MYENAVSYSLVSIYCNSRAHLICKRISTCLEKMTCSVLWQLFAVAGYSWVIRCMWSSILTTAVAPQQPERDYDCRYHWYTWLLSKLAPPPTHTCYTMSASHHIRLEKDWTLKSPSCFFSFFEILLFTICYDHFTHIAVCIHWTCFFLKDIVTKIKKNVNIWTNLRLCWLANAIFISSRYILHFSYGFCSETNKRYYFLFFSLCLMHYFLM